MRGFFGENSQYYEADSPIMPDDVEVPLRPSENHVFGPEGRWILDRRRLASTRMPTQHDYARQAYERRQQDAPDDNPSEFGTQMPRFQPPPHHMGYPPAHHHSQQPALPPAGSTGDVTVTKYGFFDFVVKNIWSVGGIVVWIVASSWTAGTKIYDMQTQLDRQTESVKSLQEELRTSKGDLKEHKEKNEIVIKGLERQISDLSIFLQTMANRQSK